MQRERDAAAAQIDSLRKRKRQLDHDIGPATRKKKALEQELEEARTDAAVAKVVGVFLEWGDPLGLLGMVVGRFGGRLVMPQPAVEGEMEVVAGGEGEGAGAGGGDGGGEGGAEGGVGDRGGRLPVVGEEAPKQGFDGLLSPPGAQSVAVEKVAAVKMEEVEGAEAIKREEQQDGEGSGSGPITDLEVDSLVERGEDLEWAEWLFVGASTDDGGGTDMKLEGVLDVSENTYAQRKRTLETPGANIKEYLAKMDMTKQELLTEAFAYDFDDAQIRTAIIKVNSTAVKMTQVPDTIYPWFWTSKRDKFEKMRKTHVEACRSFHEKKKQTAQETKQRLDAIKKAKEEYDEAVCMRENMARVRDELRGAHAGTFLLHDATRMADEARNMVQAAVKKLEEAEKTHNEHEEDDRRQETELYVSRAEELERLRAEIEKLKRGWIVHVRFALYHPEEGIDEALQAGKPPTMALIQRLALDDDPYDL
ncbi:hypothetical protein SLS55_002718 [Diplodia seriata]|uniref:Uncharacterized protein n=1 Tax=Diplodia seriata TaxID=420778 RepID=A0ABR3CT07_9PEZI